MGKLYNRGGTWYADYFDRDGRRRRESTRTKDVKVARARLRDLELATTDRTAHPSETIAAALTYFVDVACASKSGGTISCYRQKARHVAQHLGATLADKLTREDVERYIKDRIAPEPDGDEAHTHSVHKELVVLRGALKASARRGLFHGSITAIVPEFDSGYVPRKTYLTADEFVRLAENLVRPLGPRAKHPERHERRRNRRALYCLLIAFASPRAGELEALDWAHVDLARGVILLPKGKTVGRPIAIHPVLRPWLEAMHAGRGPVVEPWPNVRRDLPAAALRAGVPRVTPNDLRRTFASWLVQAGTSLYVVSRLLGHSSTRMVELVYGQLDDATLASAIARIGDGCDAGVSHAVPRPGTGGTTGHTPSSPMIRNSVEESRSLAESEVPRDGVEPPTRGFSVLVDMSPKQPQPRAKLRAV